MPSAPQWLDAAAFAAAFGISSRAARAAMQRAAEKGQAWRGAALVVRRVKTDTGRGGASGWALQVRADSLPKTADDALLPAEPIPTERQHVAVLTKTATALRNSKPARAAVLPAPVRYSPDNERLGAHRHAVIAAALAAPFNSAERVAAIQSAAAAAGVSVSTIRRWIDGYEEHGLRGLRPDYEPKRGERKEPVTRRWSALAREHLDAEATERVAAEIAHYVKRLWVSSAEASWQFVARAAGLKLRELTIAAGYAGDAGALRSACKLTRRFVERDRLPYQHAARYRQDAKAYADAQPRIRRTRQGREPMEIVFGDVHPMDVLLPRADGSTFTGKLVAFLDWATNRVFVHVVFLGKGEGVRQEHVIEAFVAMTQDPAFGVPKMLYLDNGGEYRCMELVGDALGLVTTVRAFGEAGPAIGDDGAPVRRAQPYNAAAKPIEGTFKTLEAGYFSLLPGWIGGNRMAKKTANVGRAPAPYPHGEAAFRRDLENCITAYHDAPQSGDLDGVSPAEAFARAVNAGWQRMDIDPHALRMAFARDEYREVRQGSFSYAGRRWTAPEVQALPAGATVHLRVPIASAPPDALAVMDEAGGFLCIAKPDQPYDALDVAGAQESGRRKAAARATVRDALGDAPALDMVDVLAGLAADAAPVPIPASGGVIRWNDAQAAAGRALARTPAERQADQDEDDEIALERRIAAANAILGVKTGTDG